MIRNLLALALVGCALFAPPTVPEAEAGELLTVATAAGTAVTNTTTETALSSYTFPTYAFQSGTAYHCEGSTRATATNGTDTLTNLIRLGTTAVGGTTIGTSGAVDVANNDVVTWEVDLFPRSAAGSTSGTVAVRGLVTAAGAEGTVTARATHEIVASLNFTTALVIGSTATWSVANAGNSAQAETFACWQTN